MQLTNLPVQENSPKWSGAWDLIVTIHICSSCEKGRTTMTSKVWTLDWATTPRMLEVQDPSDLTDHTILTRIHRVLLLMKVGHLPKAIEGIPGTTDNQFTFYDGFDAGGLIQELICMHSHITLFPHAIMATPRAISCVSPGLSRSLSQMIVGCCLWLWNTQYDRDGLIRVGSGTCTSCLGGRRPLI